MITASKTARRFGPALAALVVGCLAVPAYGDEFQYLPDNVRVIASVNVTTGAKTKTFQEFMKMMTAIMPKGKDQDDPVAAWISKYGRATIGVGMTDPVGGGKVDTAEVEIQTALKLITVDEVKALKMGMPKNYAWKEIKYGAVTIHQYTWTNNFDKSKEPKVIDGEAFYLAEGKYVVSSSKVAVLKKIIDRKKAATLSPVLQAGLKDAGFGNVVAVVVDVKNMPAAEREKMIMMFQKLPTYADMKANIGKVQSLTIKVNEPGKVKMSATLTCSDKPGLGTVKMIGEKTLATLKAKAKEEPKEKLPPEFMKYLDAARTAINAIQVTSMGTKVTASAEIDPEIAVNAVSGLFFVASTGSGPGPKADVKEAPKDEVKKAPSK